MDSFIEEVDEVQVWEPVLAKKDCKVRIDFAEPAEWTVKEHVSGHAGEVYKAAKLTVTITDKNVSTAHEGASPRLTLEHQFNVQRYPYLSKKTGEIAWLGRQAIYQLEEAFGFDPVFVE